jgi:hypothetical protein
VVSITANLLRSSFQRTLLAKVPYPRPAVALIIEPRGDSNLVARIDPVAGATGAPAVGTRGAGDADPHVPHGFDAIIASTAISRWSITTTAVIFAAAGAIT